MVLADALNVTIKKRESGFDEIDLITLLFFVILDFEIAVDRQTKAHEQTFEGVTDSGCPPVLAGQPRPYLVKFWLSFAKPP